MPKRNAIKQYAPKSYYHIYSRGNNKAQIFDEASTAIFLNIIKTLLSQEGQTDRFGREYPNFHNQIELLAYAIMPNHFHILVFQNNERDIAGFMKSLMTRFSTIYNMSHNHTGPVFESRYLAALITSDPHLLHISRYIHRNPPDWRSGKNTSLNYYLGKHKSDWLNPSKILRLFPSRESYLDFLKAYDPKNPTPFDPNLPNLDLNPPLQPNPPNSRPYSSAIFPCPFSIPETHNPSRSPLTTL